MQRKSLSLSLVALAAIFAGCEWTSTSGSDSWSGSYDSMNFGGTYRISTVTLSSSSSSSATDTTTTSTGNAADWDTVKDEKGGTFPGGKNRISGKTDEQNIVPGSVKISCGDYVWTDNGDTTLSFTSLSGGGSSGGSSSSYVVSKKENVGKVTARSQEFILSGSDIVPNSVTVQVGDATLTDDGNQNLTGDTSLTGKVNYNAGSVTITFRGTVQAGADVTVTYKFQVTDNTQVVTTTLSGSGKIQYSSGAWTLQVNPEMPKDSPIYVTYSYYTGVISNNGGSENKSRLSGIDVSTFDPKTVSAITVTQTGQNLTMSFNNGIVMAGKFTSVRQTAAISEDTGAGANTYNAQFQVSSGSNKMVGSLYYDYPTHNRILDGTLTLGKRVYDVHATGPAWTESGTSTAAETTYGGN